MTIEWYDRTWEQNEELGLNDMKVENYEEDAQPATANGEAAAKSDAAPSESKEAPAASS